MNRKKTPIEKLAHDLTKPKKEANPKVNKTSDKRRYLQGAKDGKPFSKENQPDPELKRKGWQRLRQERHLTQEIIKLMLGEDGTPTETFKSYIKALSDNAKKGNAKAIEVIQKSLEDDIQKIAFTDGDGNDKDLKLKIEL